MSLVRCAVDTCPMQVREGLVRPSYDRNVDGKEKADGRRCWRCRAGQTKHLTRVPAMTRLREKLRLDEPGGFARIHGFMKRHVQ